MSLEKAIRSVLINDATVASLVSTRVYPQRRPMGTSVPAVVYQTVFQETNQALETQAGIQRSRISIDCIDNTYGDTKTLRNAIQGALINYSGTLEGETIHSVRLESAVDIDEQNEPAGEFGFFRTILDFVIWHQ